MLCGRSARPRFRCQFWWRAPTKFPPAWESGRSFLPFPDRETPTRSIMPPRLRLNVAHGSSSSASDGWLADFAQDCGAALVRIPPDIQPARATFGVVVASLLTMLESVGFLARGESLDRKRRRSIAPAARRASLGTTMSPSVSLHCWSAGTCCARETRPSAPRQPNDGRRRSIRMPSRLLPLRSNRTPATTKRSPGIAATTSPCNAMRPCCCDMGMKIPGSANAWIGWRNI